MRTSMRAGTMIFAATASLCLAPVSLAQAGSPAALRTKAEAAVASKLAERASMVAGSMAEPVYLGVEKGMSKYRVDYSWRGSWGGVSPGRAFILVTGQGQVDCVKFKENAGYCSPVMTPARLAEQERVAREIQARIAAQAAANRKSAARSGERASIGLWPAERRPSPKTVRERNCLSVRYLGGTSTTYRGGNPRTRPEGHTDRNYAYENICATQVVMYYHDLVASGDAIAAALAGQKARPTEFRAELDPRGIVLFRCTSVGEAFYCTPNG